MYICRRNSVSEACYSATLLLGDLGLPFVEWK